MHAPRRRLVAAGAALALLSLLAAVACTTDGTDAGKALGDATAGRKQSSSPKWLFAAQSQGETTFDAATGRLSMPTSSLQAFTDRPYRDSRVVSPGAFANLFHQRGRNSFENDPPNAVLTYWDETNTPRTAVCEVSRGAGVNDGRLWVGLKVLEPAGATLPARMRRASLFVDDVALGTGCPNSPQDQTIVEYFNEITFNDALLLIIMDTGTSHQITLSCPPQEAPGFPPSEMQIQLASADGSSAVTCGNGTIDVPKGQVPPPAFCQNGGTACTFVLTVSNTATDAVYSTTEFAVTFAIGNNTVVPTLNPATVPICPGSFNPCILSGACSPATAQESQIQLCESPDSCTLPGG